MMESVSTSNGAGTVLNEILEDMGFGGLWRFCSLNPTQEPDKQCFAWTENLIDVSPIVSIFPLCDNLRASSKTTDTGSDSVLAFRELHRSCYPISRIQIDASNAC